MHASRVIAFRHRLVSSSEERRCTPQNAATCLCEYKLGEATCDENGHTYYACGREENWNHETCSHWNAAATDLDYEAKKALQCEWRWYECETKEECEASGECDDWDFSTWADTQGDSVWREVREACLVPFETDTWGNRQCPQSTFVDNTQVNWQWRQSGCVSFDVTQTTCEANSTSTDIGGAWKVRAKTEAECIAHGEGCKERRWYELTPKPREQCEGCGGTMKPLYPWWGGYQKPAEITPLHWLERAWSSTNRWIPSLQWHNLENVFHEAVASSIAADSLAAMRCKYAGYVPRLTTVMCSCADIPSADCVGDAALAVIIASRDVALGEGFVVDAGTTGVLTVGAGAFTVDNVEGNTVRVVSSEGDPPAALVTTLTTLDVDEGGGGGDAQAGARRLSTLRRAERKQRRLENDLFVSTAAFALHAEAVTPEAILDYNGTVPAEPAEFCMNFLEGYTSTSSVPGRTRLDVATWVGDGSRRVYQILNVTDITVEGTDSMCFDTQRSGNLIGVRRIDDEAWHVDAVDPTCPPGTFVDLGGEVCTDCVPGTFSALQDTQTACDPCPPGTAQPGAGEMTCVVCDADDGEYTENAESLTCSVCAAPARVSVVADGEDGNDGGVACGRGDCTASAPPTVGDATAACDDSDSVEAPCTFACDTGFGATVASDALGDGAWVSTCDHEAYVTANLGVVCEPHAIAGSFDEEARTYSVDSNVAATFSTAVSYRRFVTDEWALLSTEAGALVDRDAETTGYLYRAVTTATLLRSLQAPVVLEPVYWSTGDIACPAIDFLEHAVCAGTSALCEPTCPSGYVTTTANATCDAGVRVPAAEEIVCALIPVEGDDSDDGEGEGEGGSGSGSGNATSVGDEAAEIDFVLYGAIGGGVLFIALASFLVYRTRKTPSRSTTGYRAVGIVRAGFASVGLAEPQRYSRVSGYDSDSDSAARKARTKKDRQRKKAPKPGWDANGRRKRGSAR